LHGCVECTHENTFAEVGYGECFLGDNQCPAGRCGKPIQCDGVAVPIVEIAGFAVKMSVQMLDVHDIHSLITKYIFVYNHEH